MEKCLGWVFPLCAWFAWAWAGSSGAARAAQPDLPLSAWQAKHWTREDGAPAGILDLVETRDAFMWIAAAGGLTRFDGVTFDPIKQTLGDTLPPGRLLTLEADRDGGLWMVFPGGVVAHMRDLRATLAPKLAADGGQILGISVDRQGRPWVVRRNGVFELRDWRWVQRSGHNGLLGKTFDGVVFTDDGAVWVLSDAGVFQRPQEQAAFRHVADRRSPTTLGGITAAGGGGVWLWAFDGDSNLCWVRLSGPVPCWRAPKMSDPRLGPDGVLWWSTPAGFKRLPNPERLDPNDPSDLERRQQHREEAAYALAVGQDGRVWGSTGTGLHQWRRVAMRPVPVPGGALARGSAGEIYVGSYSRGLMRIGPAPTQGKLFKGQDDTLWTAAAVAQSESLGGLMSFKPLEASSGRDGPVVLQRFPEVVGAAFQLDRDPDGAVHVAVQSPPQVWRHRGGAIESVTLPELPRGALIRGMKTDSRGDFWLVASGAGVFQRGSAGWQRHGGETGWPKQNVSSLAIDGRGRVWVVSGSDGVGALAEGKWARYGADQGLAVGPSAKVYARGAQVWVIGNVGVAGLFGERFRSLIGVGGQHFVGCSAVEQLADDSLWLNCVDGVFRVGASEWRRIAQEPGHRVAFTHLDDWDGIRGTPTLSAPNPSMTAGSDEQLWFYTTDGMFRLDPSAIQAPRPAPRVVVRQVLADEVAHIPAGGLSLPIGTQRVQIGLMAPGAEVPRRTRFRYRLQGVDADWVDAGLSRTIGYHRLEPGDHLLEVVASDREGRWGSEPTVLAFHLQPAYYQTRWFHALVALAALALLALGYAWRVRQLTQRVRAEMSTRLHERMRISRDLHDTLLQSVQGLLLSLQALAWRASPEDPLRARLERAIQTAEQTVQEGRERLGTLRDAHSVTTDLLECLQAQGAALAAGRETVFAAIAPRPARPLQPLVYDELLAIGREALGNAMRHANARHVTLTLDCADAGLSLQVADDGDGLPAEVLAAGGREGHWGLPGMRERAALAGGQLRVDSAAGEGTTVRVDVAAAVAYPAAASLPARPVQGLKRWLLRLRGPRDAPAGAQGLRS